MCASTPSAAGRPGRLRITHTCATNGVREYVVAPDDELHSIRTCHPAHSTSSSVAAKLDGMVAATAAYFLPKGFPSSVGPDYVPYASWCALAGASSSAGGVLATQSLLLAVGVGTANALPLAASLNWVLKDGIGQLAAVVSAAVISDRLDADPKRWRAIAGLAEAGARCLNASTPFAPWAFLPIASLANLGYSVACLAASATKADFHRSLTRRQNLGDVTGKAGSQAIAASLVGTAVGLATSAALVTTPTHAMAGCILFSAGQLFALERSMQNLALPTLTPPVGTSLVNAFLERRPLPSPAELAASQRHLSEPSVLYRGGYHASSLSDGMPARIRFGSASIEELAPDALSLDAVRDACDGSRHLLSVDRASAEVRVLMLDGANGDDVLLALLHAGLMRPHVLGAEGSHTDSSRLTRARLGEARELAPDLSMALEAAGWDLSSALKLEESPSRVSFTSAEA